MSTRQLVMVGASGALAALLMQAVQISVFPPAPYLRWDPSDVVTLAVAIVIGPGAGVMAVLVKCVLFLIMKGLDGPFGAAMNAIASGTLAYVAGHAARSLSRRRRGGRRGVGPAALGPAPLGPTTALGRAVALAAGVGAMVLVMIPANLLVLPLQFGMSHAQVWDIMMPIVVPFNLIKGVLGAVLTYPLVSALVRSSRLRQAGVCVWGGDQICTGDGASGGGRVGGAHR